MKDGAIFKFILVLGLLLAISGLCSAQGDLVFYEDFNDYTDDKEMRREWFWLAYPNQEEVEVTPYIYLYVHDSKYPLNTYDDAKSLRTRFQYVPGSGRFQSIVYTDLEEEIDLSGGASITYYHHTDDTAANPHLSAPLLKTKENGFVYAEPREVPRSGDRESHIDSWDIQETVWYSLEYGSVVADPGFSSITAIGFYIYYQREDRPKVSVWFDIFEIVKAPEVIVLEEAIAFPNPFTDYVCFPYYASEDGQVKVVIYDEGGQMVFESIKSSISKGYNEIVWDGHDNAGSSVSSGIYTCVIFQEQGGTFIPLLTGRFAKNH